MENVTYLHMLNYSESDFFQISYSSNIFLYDETNSIFQYEQHFWFFIRHFRIFKLYSKSIYISKCKFHVLI